MDYFKLQPPDRYYSVLGLSTDASPCAIRSAYKKLAMKWHPDKCIVSDRAEAKRKFQEIQEAYAVLSDERKKMLYDNGLYDPEDDDEEIEGLSNFMDEMSGMMANVQSSEEAGKGSSFEDLQQLFLSMFSADIAALNNPPAPSISFDKKRRSWGTGSNDPTSSYIESCINESFPSQTHYFFTDTFHYGSNASTNSRKKTKCGKVAPSCANVNICTNGFINKGSGLHMTTGNGLRMTTHDNGLHATTGNGFHTTTHDKGFSNNDR